MTHATRRRLSQAALHISVGATLGVVVSSLVAQQYGIAGLQFALASLLVVLAEIIDRLHGYLDAQIEHAHIQRDLSKLAFEQLQRQLNTPGAEMRVHPADVPRWRN